MREWAQHSVLWLLLMCSAACLGEEATLAQDETLALISTLRFPSGVEVGFEQRQLNPLFSRVSTQRGVMLKGEGLVMRVTEPRVELRKLHEGNVSLTRQVRNRNIPGYRNVTRQMQLDPERASHLALLALEAVLDGRLSILQEHFSLAGTREGEAWQLRLLPRSDEVRRRMSRLWFRGEAEQLLRFRSELDDDTGGFSHFLEVSMQPPVPADN